MDVPLGAPQIPSLPPSAVAHDALAIADNARIPLKVEVRPLILQIGAREPALAVQQRLERHDNLGHRHRIGRDHGSTKGAIHLASTLCHPFWNLPDFRFAGNAGSRL